LAPASICHFCGTHVCNSHSVTLWRGHSATTKVHSPRKKSRHYWQLQHARPSSPSRCEGWHRASEFSVGVCIDFQTLRCTRLQCALCHPRVSIPPPPRCADPNFFLHYCRRQQHARPSPPESFGGCARRVSEVLAPASICNFCGAHVCNSHFVTLCCGHSATTKVHSPRKTRFIRGNSSMRARAPRVVVRVGTGRVSLVLAPASIFRFCGAHVCSARYVTLECPFRHHQRALTPTFFCIIAAPGACAPEPPRVVWRVCTVSE
jgi:hypothetical protein